MELLTGQPEPYAVPCGQEAGHGGPSLSVVTVKAGSGPIPYFTQWGAPPRRGVCMKLGPGQLASLWFFMVVKVLSHSTPGGRLGRLHDLSYKSGNQTSKRLSNLSKTTKGGKRCFFITLVHLPPCCRCLGEGQMFSKERETGRTPRAVGGQP